MNEYGYKYDIYRMDVDTNTKHIEVMNDRMLDGWETFSVAVTKTDVALYMRKPMTQWEHDQAMREKYKNDKTPVNPRRR